MRLPYLGAARVKYLLSMFEHRRLMNRGSQWAAPDFSDTRAVGDTAPERIETKAADESRASFLLRAQRDTAAIVQ